MYSILLDISRPTSCLCGRFESGEGRMPAGHPHVSWAHAGALWPVVPASDDVSHSRTHAH